MSNWLTDEQIEVMADAALVSYEISACWFRARETAREYAVDEYGITPRSSAVGLAIRIAKGRWEAIKIQTQLDIN